MPMTPENEPTFDITHAREALAGSRTFVARLRSEGLSLRRPFMSPIYVDSGGAVPNARRQSILDLAAVLGALVGFVGGGVLQLLGGGTGALALLAVGVVSALRLWLRARRSSRDAAPWYEAAEVWPGAVVMANEALHEPGRMMCPGGMVVTFDPGLADEPGRLAALAERLFEIYSLGADPESPDPELGQWMVEHLEEPGYIRRQVPVEIAGNSATWVVSMGMDRAAMPPGYLDRPVYPILLRRGFNESAVMVPHKFWSGEVEVTED